MLIYERQKNIIDFLKKKNPATVKQISRALFISEATVRRDVEKLQQAGYVERFYGGVALADCKSGVLPLARRENENSAGKEQIAHEAAKLVHDGDTVFIDSSSTAGKVLALIKNRRITVITNSSVLPEDTGNMRIYCTGGEFSEKRRCFFGSFAESFIKNIHVDILFFSCKGISAEGEITDVSEDEIALRRCMMQNSKKKVFLFDGTKFGVVSTFRLCEKEDVDVFISNIEVSFAGAENDAAADGKKNCGVLPK